MSKTEMLLMKWSLSCSLESQDCLETALIPTGAWTAKYTIQPMLIDGDNSASRMVFDD